VTPSSEDAVCGLCGEPLTGEHSHDVANACREGRRLEYVVTEIRAFLQRRASACVDAGIDRQRIVVDPGFGFGKTVAHNLELLRHLDALTALGYPVLVGMSRKATLGFITGRDVGDRLAPSIAAAVAAAARGARILRVHDVRETVDALAVWSAIEPCAASGNSRTTDQ